MDTTQLEREFEEIIKEYGGIITKICYYFSDNADDFKDLRQEVMYYIWKGLHNFRREAKISTWIYRICYNTCISFQRKERKINTVSTDSILNFPDDTSSSKLEQFETLHSLIRRLSYQERVIILLWLDDLSYEEISSLTGLNRNTVATKLKRIKEKLIKMNA